MSMTTRCKDIETREMRFLNDPARNAAPSRRSKAARCRA
jgi:hypothetical protein